VKRYAAGIVVGAAVLAAAASCSGDRAARERSDATTRVVTAAEIGVLADFGAREQGDPLDPMALLRQPFDAAFSGEFVLILDTSPPWVRVFDRQGRFVRALVPEGDGPGEAKRAFSLAGTGDGGFLLSHGLSISRLDRDGNVLEVFRDGAVWPRGVVMACGGKVYAQVETDLTQRSPGVLVRIPTSRPLERVFADTVAVLDPPRLSSRRQHAWFVHGDDERVAFFPGERDGARLLEVLCEDESVREIAIDSVGAGEREVFTDRGTVKVHRPEPPFPAGVGRVGDDVLWAVQAVAVTDRSESDSVTVITAFDADGGSTRVLLDGWWQLLDADGDGNLLLGTSWGFQHTWGLTPKVVLVDGHALLGAAK